MDFYSCKGKLPKSLRYMDEQEEQEYQVLKGEISQRLNRLTIQD